MPTPAKDAEKAIPRPPSPEELDRISQDQALIADEWAPEPPPAGTPKPG